ncbi:MAG: hypothetical protein ACYSUY_09275 [Planctomycetota bacterium]|jgi:uncharacterized protein YwgA
MDRQQIGLKLTVDGLNLPFQISTFEDRLILQKAVYLAQAAGVNLGYYYHWYLYGPYSPSLTRDEYAIGFERGQGVDDSEGWKLDDESTGRLKKLQSLIPKGNRPEVRKKLELLASVHFLVNRRQVRQNDAREIAATLERFKKDFSEEEVQNALRELVDYGLLAA